MRGRVRRSSHPVVPEGARWEIGVRYQFRISLQEVSGLPSDWDKCSVRVREGRTVYGSSVATCNNGTVHFPGMTAEFAVNLNLDAGAGFLKRKEVDMELHSWGPVGMDVVARKACGLKLNLSRFAHSTWQQRVLLFPLTVEDGMDSMDEPVIQVEICSTVLDPRMLVMERGVEYAQPSTPQAAHTSSITNVFARQLPQRSSNKDESGPGPSRTQSSVETGECSQQGHSSTVDEAIESETPCDMNWALDTMDWEVLARGMGEADISTTRRNLDRDAPQRTECCGGELPSISIRDFRGHPDAKASCKWNGLLDTVEYQRKEWEVGPSACGLATDMDEFTNNGKGPMGESAFAEGHVNAEDNSKDGNMVNPSWALDTMNWESMAFDIGKEDVQNKIDEQAIELAPCGSERVLEEESVNDGPSNWQSLLDTVEWQHNHDRRATSTETSLPHKSGVSYTEECPNGACTASAANRSDGNAQLDSETHSVATHFDGHVNGTPSSSSQNHAILDDDSVNAAAVAALTNHRRNNCVTECSTPRKTSGVKEASSKTEDLETPVKVGLPVWNTTVLHKGDKRASGGEDGHSRFQSNQCEAKNEVATPAIPAGVSLENRRRGGRHPKSEEKIWAAATQSSKGGEWTENPMFKPPLCPKPMLMEYPMRTVDRHLAEVGRRALNNGLFLPSDEIVQNIPGIRVTGDDGQVWSSNPCFSEDECDAGYMANMVVERPASSGMQEAESDFMESASTLDVCDMMGSDEEDVGNLKDNRVSKIEQFCSDTDSMGDSELEEQEEDDQDDACGTVVEEVDDLSDDLSALSVKSESSMESEYFKAEGSKKGGTLTQDMDVATEDELMELNNLQQQIALTDNDIMGLIDEVSGEIVDGCCEGVIQSMAELKHWQVAVQQQDLEISALYQQIAEEMRVSQELDMKALMRGCQSKSERLGVSPFANASNNRDDRGWMGNKIRGPEASLFACENPKKSSSMRTESSIFSNPPNASSTLGDSFRDERTFGDVDVLVGGMPTCKEASEVDELNERIRALEEELKQKDKIIAERDETIRNLRSESKRPNLRLNSNILKSTRSTTPDSEDMWGESNPPWDSARDTSSLDASGLVPNPLLKQLKKGFAPWSQFESQRVIPMRETYGHFEVDFPPVEYPQEQFPAFEEDAFYDKNDAMTRFFSNSTSHLM